MSFRPIQRLLGFSTDTVEISTSVPIDEAVLRLRAATAVAPDLHTRPPPIYLGGRIVQLWTWAGELREALTESDDELDYEALIASPDLPETFRQGEFDALEGAVDGLDVRAHLRTRDDNRATSYFPIFRGRLESTDEGAVLRGRFELAKSVRLFTAFWTLSLAAAVAATFVLWWTTDFGTVAEDASRSQHLIPLIPVALLAFGTFGARRCTKIGESERLRLTELLYRALQPCR